MLGRLIASILPLLVVCFAFGCIFMGPQRTGALMTRMFAGLTRATLGVALLGIFTMVDAFITASLSSYQVATARPYLAPEAWHQFAIRFNDRLYRFVLAG